jgi:hypothetical protein
MIFLIAMTLVNSAILLGEMLPFYFTWKSQSLYLKCIYVIFIVTTERPLSVVHRPSVR